MRILFIVPLVLMSLVSFPSWGNDYKKAFDTYQSGDYADAFRKFTPLAEQGNAFAQYYLGYLYYSGEGIPIDRTAAVRWFSLAAAQGHPHAQFLLAVAYFYGDGITQNYENAKYWYAEAEKRGNRIAEVMLRDLSDEEFMDRLKMIEKEKKRLEQAEGDRDHVR